MENYNDEIPELETAEAIGLATDPSKPSYQRPTDQEILNYERRLKVD